MAINLNAIKRPWLSILIPVYNVENYLEECLISVISQAEQGVEVITLDDCSTDNSYSVLRNIVDKSPHPIAVLQSAQNYGLSAARNTMINKANGEFVWFLDSDDYLYPNAIAELRAVVNRHNPDFIMCNYTALKGDKTRSKRSFKGPKGIVFTDKNRFFDGLFCCQKLHIWSKISRRSLWETGLRFPEGRNMEDIVVTPRLGLLANTYFYQPSNWVVYRKRPNSILSTYSIKRVEDTAQALDGILNFWIEHYPQLSDKAKLSFSLFAFNLHIENMKALVELSDNYGSMLKQYCQNFHSQIQWSRSDLHRILLRYGYFYQFLRFEKKYRIHHVQKAR